MTKKTKSYLAMDDEELAVAKQALIERSYELAAQRAEAERPIRAQQLEVQAELSKISALDGLSAEQRAALIDVASEEG